TSGVPLATAQAVTTLELAGGALANFASADFDLNGYPDFVVPGANNGTPQAAPEMIINGTINIGTISYTPQNGQSLTGQNFINIDYQTTENPVVVASSLTRQAEVTPASIKPESRKLKLGGRVFIDRSQDSRLNAGEPGLGGVRIYLDENKNGQFDPGIDDLTVTNSLGYFAFTDVEPGLSCPVGFVELPSAYQARPVQVNMPQTSSTGVVLRNITVNLSWFESHPVLVAIAPLTPVSIDLSSSQLRDSLGFQPIYRLSGTVPAGMSINPLTGKLTWTAPASASEQSYKIEIEALKPANRNALQRQTTTLTIQVRTLTNAEMYVRNLFSSLFNRLPLPGEETLWAGRLQNGWKTTNVVNSLAHTDERYALLTRQVYQTVLGRVPNKSETEDALCLFRSGGNSDQLSLRLLTGPEFSKIHVGNGDFVGAVNRILQLNGASRSAYFSQVTWLNAGGTRTSLVNRLFRSQAATTSRAIQLAGWFSGVDASQKSIRQWATALATGALNSDTLTTLIMGSESYAKATSALSIHNWSDHTGQATEQYNKLAYLHYTLTGTEADRTTLDALQYRLYKGQTWNNLTRELYNSQAGVNYRIQRQYQNLLQRRATAAELTQLQKTLPAANQVESLQIQILSGNAYRGQFGSSVDYVDAVFQVLTGHGPTAVAAEYYARRLEQGLDARKFVRQIATSGDGIAGQINRNYLEILGRTASQAEVSEFRQLFGKSDVQDRIVSIQLLSTDEFRQKQRQAMLLPVL
ncbi:MAG: putative Ig domain-containing protein, partial [bacterium]